MNANQPKFVRFVDRSLLLSTAPVLESLHFKLDRQCSEVDVVFWVETAVERGLRELNFDYRYMTDEPMKLPQSLYTCGTLVVLKLKHVSLEDVKFPVCFQLLKTLHLDYVIFLNDESSQELLSSCPVLEDLFLTRAEDDNVNTFSVMVPSLQRFIYDATDSSYTYLLMNTPSLKYLMLDDLSDLCQIEEYMPEIVEAHVDVTCYNVDDILRYLASVKRLFLCVPTAALFPTGRIFHQLVHLEYCTYETEWDLLMSMLRHSPKLRSLKLNETKSYGDGPPTCHWDEPISVPETLMFVLETLEWRNYRGGKRELALATFILKHSRRLNIASFFPLAHRSTTLEMKYLMITQLARLSRGSAKCELVFD
ncbi:FBD-associated F-box protein [Cardamine amara subsp. amara]|uniref:FBD-associated F-box protein n=1 Tax=Cardamine amara subsp. amara TaxID=228776 RepID=A0ABD0ZKU5_CARAN